MIGETILHYKILEKLGEGGMGVVYLAEDTKLERKVAIKFLPRHIAGNSEERERFKIEAKATAALNHPNIATIYAIEETEDQMFISMEYIKGKELKDIVGSYHDKSLPINDLINYSIQIVEGLDAAHKEDITHRDIKSSNIMITDDGKVKIMDFGLAKVRGGSQLTQMGSTVGTVAYMSPEQSRGDEVDSRTDIWSFGVVLYEMLTGKMPFKGDYDQAIIYSIINEEHSPVAKYSEFCPPALEGIINKCLEKDRNERYATVSELLKDLRLFEQDPDYEPNSKTIKVEQQKNKGVKTKKIIAIPVIIVTIIALSFLLPKVWQKIKDIAGWNSTPRQQHLVILPLTNIGGDAGKQAFCNGLMETLSSNLTQTEQFQSSLWVVPASEVIQNNITSISEANKRYGVNLVVTGSLQFMDNMLRLNLNLVDAKNLRQLNSSTIDISSKDVSSVQDKAVIKLLQMLHIEMEPELKDILFAGKTSVPEAYEYYVQGKGNLQRYENTENVEEAIRLFKLATESDTKYALAYSGLGEAYWRDYELTKKPELAELAMTEAKKGFELDSSISFINVTLGIIYNGTGNYDLAIVHFNRALSQDPSNAAAFRGLANAYQSVGNNSNAELTFKRAIKLKPDYWAGHNDLGVFYYKHSRYEDAINQFKKVIKLTPDNYRGYSNLGGIFYLLERWSDAREMFEKSLQIHSSYNTYSNLGTLYYIEGNFENAAKMYEQALKINDKDYLTWGNLAAAYHWITGKSKDAIETYKKAISLAKKNLEVNPDDPEINSNLAAYYADVEDTSNAFTLLKKSIDAAPTDVMVMYRAATIYEHLGYREKALYWIGKALRNGYSRSEIEHQPELKQLIADDRYKHIVSDQNKTENN